LALLLKGDLVYFDLDISVHSRTINFIIPDNMNICNMEIIMWLKTVCKAV